MTFTLIILLWACLAVFALTLRCEYGPRYLTSCQLFWIVLLHPPFYAVLGAMVFVIGLMLVEIDVSSVMPVLAGLGVSICLIGVLIAAIVTGCVLYIKAGQCHVIWRRR